MSPCTLLNINLSAVQAGVSQTLRSPLRMAGPQAAALGTLAAEKDAKRCNMMSASVANVFSAAK